MDLNSEIAVVKKAVVTDAYQMSVGEIINLYIEKDLIINPAFQRLFRWDSGQKSKFIESLLLGIPIPSIFVFETPEGKWELIDGLQRSSTILEFVGVLEDPDNPGSLLPPSCLESTSYLPSLHNAVWETSERIPLVPVEEQSPIEKIQQLAIKRSRLGVEILKRPSEPRTKFDLFQRLNSGGTAANPQELRNCIAVMIDEDSYKSIEELANSESFAALTSFTEDQKTAQKHLEYAMRYLVYRHIPYERNLDVEAYIDDGIVTLLQKKGVTNAVRQNFVGTFDLIFNALGENGLRKFSDGQFKGRVGLTALETVAVGIGSNLLKISKQSDPAEFVRQRVKAMWSEPEVEQYGRAGLRGTQRLKMTIPLGVNWFKPA